MEGIRSYAILSGWNTELKKQTQKRKTTFSSQSLHTGEEVGGYDELNYNSDKDLIGYTLKLPEIIHHSKEILSEGSKIIVLSSVEKACEDLKKFRKNEGSALQRELSGYLNSILDNLLKINKFEIERLPKVKEKLKKAIDELSLKNQIDEKRLEQELIYYSEKIDITEEKVRLKEHCLHFKQSIKENYN